MVLARLRRRSAGRRAAESLYTAIVAQSRQSRFYTDAGVPDTVDGRFELICLHAYLVMRRLKADGAGAETAQALFDAMFADMDRNLREMGAGDLGVGRRVKAMAKAFYGRIAAYDEGLQSGQDALGDALRRNLYGTTDPAPADVARLAVYVAREHAELDKSDVARLIAGELSFGPPPEAPLSGASAA